jgi:hypothetical protein
MRSPRGPRGPGGKCADCFREGLACQDDGDEIVGFRFVHAL